jgi:hypothetical protein
MAVIEAIGTTYLEADASSVTFSSIPSTYEHLQLRASIRSTDSGAGGYSGNLKCRVNGQSAGYWNQTIQGGDYNYAGSVSASSSVSGAADDYMNLGWGPTSLQDAAVYGSVIFNILDYSNTNKNSAFQTFSGYGLGDGDGEGMSANYVSNLLDSYTSAIDTILLYGHNNFVRGSEFTLFGIQDS